MGAEQVQTVHFTVTGQYLTDVARQLMLSDEPGKAYRIIANSLVGDDSTSGIALAILRGTHNLTGDSTNGIYMVEAEDDEELRSYHESVSYIYAGRHRYYGVWRRPLARVTTFGQTDANYASKNIKFSLEAKIFSIVTKKNSFF